MVTIQTTYSQYRTFGHTYLFKVRADAVTLKIFDVFRKMVEKIILSFPLDDKLIQDNPYAALQNLAQRKQIPESYLPPSFFQSPIKKECLEELGSIIQQCTTEEVAWELVEEEDTTVQKTVEQLSLAKCQLEDEKIEAAILILIGISHTHFKINSVLIKLYVLTNKKQEALLLVTETAERLKDQQPNEAIRLYKQVLAYIPTHWVFYTLLSSLLDSPSEKSHILLKGALEAIQQKESARAAQFCGEAQEIYADSFTDRWVDLEYLRCKNQEDRIKEKILSLIAYYERTQLLQSSLQACKMLVRLEYSADYCQRIIEGYRQLDKKKKALKWFSVLLQQEELNTSDRKGNAPLYKILDQIDDRKDPALSEDLWSRLGKIYLKHDCLGSAKESFQKAFEVVPTFDNAIQLATIFDKQGTSSKSIPYYYEASNLAFLDLAKVSLCLQKIDEIDPSMRLLDLAQQRQIALHKQRVALYQELNAMKEKLSSSHKLGLSFILNASEWLKFSGKVVTETALPETLRGTLARKCPFFSSKTVGETHRLVFMPKGLTINQISQNTILDPQIKDAWGDHQVAESYWVLITPQSIPNSIGLDRTAQDKLLKDAGVQYRFPTLLEVLYLCLLGKGLEEGYFYGTLPSDYTRCQEELEGEAITVGGFGPQGIYVNKGFYLLGTGACLPISEEI